jgi:hypothetical protein
MTHFVRSRTLAICMVGLMLVLSGLTACQSPTGPIQSRSVSPLMVTSPVEVSPIVTPVLLRPFHLDRPLLAGATRVVGQGPAGSTITVVDVTMGAEPIGTGKISAEGTFAVDVKLLPEGHRIGVMAQALLPDAEANLGSLWGEGGVDLPMIGKVFDSVMTVTK